ncbi:MAG: acetylxylan esterase, partial [Verrucomicrobiaceae bacterium]|nr:acetylxylan esterase [Verrucomicrobiaceae bacterium]
VRGVREERACFLAAPGLECLMRRLILITCLVVPPLAVLLGWLWAGAWALAILLLPAGLYLWATLNPQCDWWGPVMNSFPTRHREVLLTFDDGPDPEETPLILDLLDAQQAKGLFFITGSRACEHPALVQEIVARGHAIGVQPMHYLPSSFWRLPPEAMKQEIAATLTALHGLLPDHELRWFRAPGGRRNHWLDPQLAHYGLTLMGCSACDDGLKMRSFDDTVIRLRHDIDLGGLVCLHHGQTDRSGERTLIPLVEELLLWLRGQGYKLGE